MNNFNKLVDSILNEMAANVAGGPLSVTGPSTAGSGGGAFNVQDDRFYAPNDARWVFGSSEDSETKSKKKKKKKKINIQRRTFSRM